MANVKYRVREYTPTENQMGQHSFFAQSVVDNEINNLGLAKKVAARTGIKSYEASMVIAAISDIVAEETLENNRVTLSNEDGKNFVSFYPRVSGRITDKEVQENQQKYAGKSVAEESMLTQDRLTWTLGATVGVKYSKMFAMNKTAQKVEYNPSQTVAEPTEDAGGNGGGNNGGGGGEDPNGGNEG